jgi:hypothetical protein
VTVEAHASATARRRLLPLILTLAVLGLGLQFGVRWVLREGEEWRCQITEVGWERYQQSYRADLPRSLQHSGAIYEGDSGCDTDGGAERCFVSRVRIFWDALEPCE